MRDRVCWISISGGFDDDALRDAWGIGRRLLTTSVAHTYHTITPGDGESQDTDCTLATLIFFGTLPLLTVAEYEIQKYFESSFAWADVNVHKIEKGRYYITVD